MISGWEWIIILLAAVVLLIWGPSKIPELARGIGRAKGEFEKTSREYAHGTAPEKVIDTSKDDMILLIAKALGVRTEGKSKEDIFQEIIKNIKVGKSIS